MNNFPLAELIIALYTFSLSVLFIYSLHGFVMLYYKHKFKNKSYDSLESIDTTRIVTIQLPLYNEMYVAERLINAVCNIDYPKESLEIQVLDDSTDETTTIVSNIVAKKRAEGFSIYHIQRSNRAGFKAGALRNGLAKAKGEFIAIFDADFIPSSDFLKTTLPYFISKNIGMVQTRWAHLNENHSLLTHTQAFALNGHFAIEQKVRNDANFFINFNGTAGIWRKDCIIGSGNWELDTLTEDLDLSYRAQMKGWKFVFLKDTTTPAELPTDINALRTQQFRWTKGAIETAKKLLSSVWKSDLGLRVKLQSTFHLTNNIVFPFVVIVALLNLPMLLIKHIGNFQLYFQLSSVFIFAFISTFLLYTTAQKSIHKDWIKRILLFPVFLSGTMGLSLNNSKAFFEGMLNKKSEFVRTPKLGNEKISSNKYITRSKISLLLITEIFFTLYSLAGVVTSIYLYEFAALPFNLMFFFGFFSVSFLSLRQVLIKN